MTLEQGNNLEIIIGDLADSLKITTAEELEELSQELHDHIDSALCDYAADVGIEDFTPTY